MEPATAVVDAADAEEEPVLLRRLPDPTNADLRRRYRERMLELQRETVRLRREIDWMHALREERQRRHERLLLARLRAPAPGGGGGAVLHRPRLAPPPWSDALLRLSWCGDRRLVSLSAAFYDARPPTERDTPSADCCDRLADVVDEHHRQQREGGGLGCARERRLPTTRGEEDHDGVRWMRLFYLPRRGGPDAPALARAVWRHLLLPPGGPSVAAAEG